MGAPEGDLLVVQNNLANTYRALGRFEEALSLQRDVYSGFLKLYDKEHDQTLAAASNYAATLRDLEHFEEGKALLRKMMPVAQRVLGEGHRLTLKMRLCYAQQLSMADGATLDDLREAATTLEDAGRIARRVFGGSNPLTKAIDDDLQNARA